jgi:hypothetical protein
MTKYEKVKVISMFVQVFSDFPRAHGPNLGKSKAQA